LTELLRNIFKEDSFLGKLNVVLLWEEVADKEIKKHASALKFQKNVLYVIVESPVWAQELKFFKTELIEKLNKKIGSDLVSDIRFKVGGIDK